jgi:hypothetical protein
MLAVAPQNDRLARNPRKPEFVFVDGGQRTFTDGDRVVEMIDIGPSPHAREMLSAYLPKQRIVFQGDLFFLPYNDAQLDRRGIDDQLRSQGQERASRSIRSPGSRSLEPAGSSERSAKIVLN